MRTDMGREGMDGGWAWVVLAAVLCSQILLGGICFSAGIFYFIFEREFDSNPVELSWLCSLPTTMWLISTPVGSLLVNKFGYRICAFSGGLVSALGMTLSCFAPAKYFLFFSHGIVTGVLYNLTGTYSSSFYLAGASSVIASLLMIHPIVCRRRNTMQKKRGLSEIIAEQEVFQVERKQTFLCDDKYTPSYKEDNADM
ncbi:monocarboxylate transporter 13-like isoform X2 [Mya arenaria]|uniref:monocarboxylate transporter 13-like isoform X2 n=1 Tax=Mya arenaria TaxID=6604 RepID=UPI0022E00786|nr:monocarboxylate transporter 13-like isoform X2 [Mya arenaria]